MSQIFTVQSLGLEALYQEWNMPRLLLIKVYILSKWSTEKRKEQKDTTCYQNTLHLQSFITSIKI